MQLKDRREHVPPEYYRNPLATLLTRFDKDGDGFLDVDDVHAALRGKHDVSIDQTDLFVDAVGERVPEFVNWAEFEKLVHKMGETDLAVNGLHVNW
jgi:hypothetical protein